MKIREDLLRRAEEALVRGKENRRQPSHCEKYEEARDSDAASARVEVLYRMEAALRERAARALREAAAARRLVDSLGGLPPSNPFLRDDSAFLFDLTEPRQAGQKETRSILWI